MAEQLDGKQSKSSLVKLQQLVEKIPSGVRPEDVGRILELDSPEETTTFIKNRITERLKEALETLWETHQIEEKLKSKDAYLTKRCDIDEFKIKYLQRKKQFLEELINKTKQELDEDYDYLQENLKKIEKFEEKMKK